MSKKEILFPFIFAGLSFAFVIICLAVYLSAGKSRYWIAQKIKIGALLLGITAFVNTGCRGRVTCYVQVAPNNVAFHENKSELINCSLLDTSKIEGTISFISANSFSYMITDSTYANIIIQENLLPNDGVWNTNQEAFSIKLPPGLKPGNYYLLIFPFEKERQSKINYVRRAELVLTK